MTTDPEQRSAPFLIFGHRGSPRRFRENTILSLRGALDEGADGFETDVRRLEDGSIVLFHDSEVNGRDTEEFVPETLAGRFGPLARLRDLHLLLAEHHLIPIVEVKRGGWEAQLVQGLTGVERLVVSSFDHRILADLGRRNPGFQLGAIVFAYLYDAGAYCQRLGVTWFFPEHRFVDRPLVDDCHARGIRVVPWSPNRVDQWERMRDCGCDGMITDLPMEAVAWRASKHS